MRIILISLAIAFFVLAVSLVMQWLIYSDWMHRTGPLRIVGTSLATILAFAFMLRWQLAIRANTIEMVRRFEMIARMNDRVRNSLQAIECTTYLSQPSSTEFVRQQVEAIDAVLREVLDDMSVPAT